MKRTTTLLTIAVFALTTTTAVWAATTTQVVPVAMVVNNPCNGDAIALEGQIRAVIGTTTNANGQHYHVVYNYQLAGESIADGTKYVLKEVLSQNLNIRPGAVGEQTIVQRINLIGQGQAPNYVAHATYHITVNDNGDVTVNFVKMNIDCH